MQIQWIQGENFRNYRTLSYSPGSHLNILTGPNGQGKTNLLEGLGLLMLGRSFRGARPADLPRWEAPGATLTGELRRVDAARVLRRDISRREDGAWSVTGEGCPWARVIAFGWQDLAIVNGGPQGRRSFIDGFAGKIFPAHLAALARYRQVVGRRNRLLLSRGEDGRLAARLDPWDEQLAQVGLEIVDRRRLAGGTILREVSALYPALGGTETVRVEYRSSLGERPTGETFREALAKARREEIRRGQTLVGPHRDDLVIDLDGRDARTFGSRGQQRLLALALRLAEAGPVGAAVGSPPILLLDDALSELDPAVQAKVLRHVETAGQGFLTTAEAALPARRARWWEIREGGVEDTTLEPVRGAA